MDSQKPSAAAEMAVTPRLVGQQGLGGGNFLSWGVDVRNGGVLYVSFSNGDWGDCEGKIRWGAGED